MEANETKQEEKERLLNIGITLNSAAWALCSKIKLGSDVFNFKDRPYLVEPMRTKHPRKGAMKATQGGFSISMGILPSLHGLIYGHYPNGVFYLFPTDKAMLDYSQSIIDPVIKNNKEVIGRFCKKSSGKSVDKVGLKIINGRPLYMRGATLNPSESTGVSSSPNLSGISADRLIPDEVDLIDPKALADARGRMGAASAYGIEGYSEEVILSNPTCEDYGVDLYWQKSDQRLWYGKCTCGFEMCFILEFFNDPEKTVGIYPELDEFGQQRGFIRCKKCEKPINVLIGKYHPQKTGTTEWIFWHYSYIQSIYQNPAQILHDFRFPPDNDLAGVYKNKLGWPYSSAEDKLQKHTVLACCGHDAIPDHHTGPCAMGVDNDDAKHVVIITKTGNDRYKLIKPIRVDGFNDVYDLIRRFRIKSAVVDLRPNKDAGVAFQKAAASIGCKVYLCEYTESPLQDENFNDNTGVVKVYRTGVFDRSHRIITNQQILLPRQCAVVEEFARQCCNCAKQKNERIKDKVIYQYIKTGDQHDHYRNSLNYALVAASGHKIGIANNGRRSLILNVDNNYRRI